MEQTPCKMLSFLVTLFTCSARKVKECSELDPATEILKILNLAFPSLGDLLLIEHKSIEQLLCSSNTMSLYERSKVLISVRFKKSSKLKASFFFFFFGNNSHLQES